MKDKIKIHKVESRKELEKLLIETLWPQSVTLLAHTLDKKKIKTMWFAEFRLDNEETMRDFHNRAIKQFDKEQLEKQ